MEAVVLEDEVLQILIVGDGNERVEVPGRTPPAAALGFSIRRGKREGKEKGRCCVGREGRWGARQHGED